MRDFSARHTDGRTFDLRAHSGEALLLAFFATWSKPSVVELRHLQHLYDRWRNDGLTVVGIAVDGPETIADVSAFAARNGLTFPLLLDEESHVASLYNPKRDVPLTVLAQTGWGTTEATKRSPLPCTPVDFRAEAPALVDRESSARSLVS